MSLDEIPATLERFVAHHITSVEQLLILQVLCENPGRAWTIAELTKELRSAQFSVENRLQNFYAQGVLLAPHPGSESQISFKPASAETKDLLLLLVKTFKTHPNRIVSMIYSQPQPSIKAFADSFKLHKDEED